jgi:hypothetical protein
LQFFSRLVENGFKKKEVLFLTRERNFCGGGGGRGRLEVRKGGLETIFSVSRAHSERGGRSRRRPLTLLNFFSLGV